MPVSTDHLADEVKELREAHQNLADSIRTLVHEFGNFRVEIVDRLGSLNTGIRVEVAEKLGAINANLEASRERTDASLTGIRGEFAEKFGTSNANLEASRERTSEFTEKFGALIANLEASGERTVDALTGIRVEVAEKFGSINANLEGFRERTENALRIAFWRIGILVPLVLSLIGGGFWITWQAAKLDSRVERVEAGPAKEPATVPAPKSR